MPRYRWLPEGSSSPKQHLSIGGLIFGETYNHPDCAHDPDFKLIEDDEHAEDAPPEAPDEPEPDASDEPEDEPDADAEGAGESGKE